MSNHPKLAALAVVVREHQVLLVKRRNAPDAGFWGFPGGHVDLGETAMEAAVRELREETGVIARPIRYLTNVDLIERDKIGNIQFHFLLAAVLCEYVGGEPAAEDDVSQAAWRSVEDVLNNQIRMSDQVDYVLELGLEEREY